MRLGLVLADGTDAQSAARAADELGLFGVLVGGPPGTETARAAAIAAVTRNLRIVVRLRLGVEHPLTLAEEVAVLDNLARGRVVVVAEAAPGTAPDDLADFGAALAGHVVGAVLIAPPPAQPSVPVWFDGSNVEVDHLGWPRVAHELADLAGAVRRPSGPRPAITDLPVELADAADAIARWRDAGCTHLLAASAGDPSTLARHLATRAATVDFPTIVADLADRIAPFDR